MSGNAQHVSLAATRLDRNSDGSKRWASARLTAVQVEVRARRREFEPAHWRLLLAWACVVFTPWVFQARSFVNLALPHAIPSNLVISTSGHEPSTEDLIGRCPVRGLEIARVWWNVWPTQYVVVEEEEGDSGYD